MATLTLQRCLRHAEREAVARCPQCGDFFCRECVTEHDDRVICASCLEKIEVQETRRSGFWRWPLRGVGMLAGFLAAVLFFYSFGKVLVLAPSSFHEGTLWKKTFLEDDE